MPAMRETPGCHYAAARRHLDVARVDPPLVVRQLRAGQCAVDVRSAIHGVERETPRKANQHVDEAGTRNRRKRGVVNGLRKADVDGLA